MKRIYTLVVSLLLFFISNAQVMPGDGVTIGIGSLKGGQFAYIIGPNKVDYTGKKGLIMYANKKITRRYDNGTWVNVKIDGVRGYPCINIDSAISTGEVIMINGQPAKQYFSSRPVDEATDETTESSLDMLINAIDEGCTLTLGRGTRDNGAFTFIGIGADSWISLGTYAEKGQFFTEPLDAQYGGMTLTVKKIKRFGNKKVGFKKLAVVGAGNIVNYQVDLYGAITSGEIVAVNGRPITRAGQWVSDVQVEPSGASKAQKLLDWKKLLDAGGITQHEYDSIKNVLLHQ